MRKLITTLLFVSVVLTHLNVSQAYQAPVLEISFGERKSFSVNVTPTASRVESSQRRLARKGDKAEVPFALSADSILTFSKSGDQAVVNHGSKELHCLFLNAESALAEFWTLPGKGQLSPLGSEVLLQGSEALELINQHSEKTKLNSDKFKLNSSLHPDQVFGVSGNVYALHAGENKTKDKVRFFNKTDGAPKLLQVVVSGDESKLLTTNWTPSGPVFGKVTVFDVASGEPVGERKFFNEPMLFAQFSPSGDRCTACGPDKAYCFNVPSLETEKEFQGGGPAGFSKDGKSIWVADDKRSFSLHSFDPNDSESRTTPITAFSSNCMFDRNVRGNQHLSQGFHVDAEHNAIWQAGSFRNSYSIIDFETGKQIGRMAKNSHTKGIDFKNKLVYLQGHSSKEIQVHDFEGVVQKKFPVTGSAGAGFLCLSPDGSKFLYSEGWIPQPTTNRYDMPVAVHDAKTGKKIRSLGKFDVGLHPQFSPDGKMVLFQPKDYRLVTKGNETGFSMVLVDFDSGQTMQTFYVGPWFCSHVEFSRDSKQLLVCGSINIDFWRLRGDWDKMPKAGPSASKEFDELARDWPALKITDLKGDTPPLEIRGLTTDVSRRAILSDDGSKFLLLDRFEKLTVWDSQTGNKIHQIDRRLRSANKDLSEAIVGHIDDTQKPFTYHVELWDLVDAKMIHPLTPFKEDDETRGLGVKVIASDWSKRHFIAAGHGRIRTFKLNEDGSCEAISESQVSPSVSRFQVRPAAGQRRAQLVTHHGDGSIRFLDAQSLIEIGRAYFFEDGAWVAIRADGKFTGSESVGDRLSWQQDTLPTVSGKDAEDRFFEENLVFANE